MVFFDDLRTATDLGALGRGRCGLDEQRFRRQLTNKIVLFATLVVVPHSTLCEKRIHIHTRNINVLCKTGRIKYSRQVNIFCLTSDA